MSARTHRQRETLRAYQQCRDMEAGLLAREGISLWRIAAGVLAGAAVLGLFGLLAMGLQRMGV